jgi:hypothetical protein
MYYIMLFAMSRFGILTKRLTREELNDNSIYSSSRALFFRTPDQFLDFASDAKIARPVLETSGEVGATLAATIGLTSVAVLR